MIDMTKMIAANSDQLNAVDLLGGPLVATITGAKEHPGDKKQPLSLRLDSWPQPWKPCLTMRRLLIKVFRTGDATKLVGETVVLYNDPSVKWKGEPHGGVRMKEASGLDKPFSILLPSARGKYEEIVVEPYRPKQPATLASMCEQHGITPEGLDKWHRSQFDGKPAPADGSKTAAELAAYLPTNAEWLTAAKRASSTIMGGNTSTGSEE